MNTGSWLLIEAALHRSALDTVGRQGELALSLLRAQLGEADREEILPAAVSLAIGQSPVLVSGQEAVLRLPAAARAASCRRSCGRGLRCMVMGIAPLL